MNRQEYITIIIKLLTRLPKLVESSNKLNLTDINNFSEDFYEGLLNLIYGFNLENANKADLNAVAIDLRDTNQRIAIQVTSTSALAKTKKTVNKFIEYNLNEDFDRLVILNIVKKSVHKDKTIGGNSFSLNTEKDIWDINDLLKDIKFISDSNLIKLIHNYLVKELQDRPATTLPNEVNTILGLIEYISDQKHPDAGNGLIEDPDPEGKILKRFSDHSDYLKNRYSDLFIEYGTVLNAVNEENDFGSQTLRRAGNFLKGYSDKILTSCNGDPKVALTQLLENFEEILSNNGFPFDSGAAEFYIIDQLISCNIFPNRLVANG